MSQIKPSAPSSPRRDNRSPFDLVSTYIPILHVINLLYSSINQTPDKHLKTPLAHPSNTHSSPLLANYNSSRVPVSNTSLKR